MQFPKDHYTHDTSIEWWYFWGRFNNGDFFHYATFRGGKGSLQHRTSHWSLHNSKSEYWEEIESDLVPLKYTSGYMANTNRFYLETKHFGLNMIPKDKPIQHIWERQYYSIPSLEAEGHLYPDTKIFCDVWIDHEWGKFRTLKPWNWITIKLDCGINIMICQTENDKLGMIQFGDKVILPEFCLRGNDLFINNLSMNLVLVPLVNEKIFYPTLGLPYSEIPIDVIGNSKKIGYGIMEKSYAKNTTN